MGRTAGRANENKRIVLSLPGLHSFCCPALHRRHQPPAFQREVIKHEQNISSRRYVLCRFGPGDRLRAGRLSPCPYYSERYWKQAQPHGYCGGHIQQSGRQGQAAHHYLLQAENGLELPSLVLLEQLRTIDKKRLGAYIGHLEEKHIRKINHALAVSVGLIEEVPENLIMCLCPACANNFYGTGSYYLRRVHPSRVEKDICTYCGQRPGFDYEVVKRRP